MCNLCYEWYSKIRHIRNVSIAMNILLLNGKLLLSRMSKLICYIFPLLHGQKFFPNHWPSRSFLRQLLITFSSKIEPRKARVDLLYCRGQKRWIKRHSTPLISIGKVQKLFIRLSKLEYFPLNSLGIFFTCFHSADV